MKVAILAGGLGTRLSEETAVRPMKEYVDRAGIPPAEYLRLERNAWQNLRDIAESPESPSETRDEVETWLDQANPNWRFAPIGR